MVAPIAGSESVDVIVCRKLGVKQLQHEKTGIAATATMPAYIRRSSG
jgi:hypothetical protein